MRSSSLIGSALAATGAVVASAAIGAGLTPDRARDILPHQRGAAIAVEDVDADLIAGGRIRLEAETRGAARVTFTYGGRQYRARVAEIDDDGDREWTRTAPARAADRRGGRVVVIRARACAGERCVVRSAREYLERPGDDD